MVTDQQCRRIAMQMLSQLPADKAAARTIVDYVQGLLPFAHCEADLPAPKVATLRKID